MANDKNNISELVSDDDDPTAELETLTLMDVASLRDDDDLSESAAKTYDSVDDEMNRDSSISELKSDLKTRSETINRLQFDIEHLRAKWIGLETEIKSREALTKDLNRNLDEARDNLARKEKLVKKRDQKIKALKAEIRDRNDEYDALNASVSESKQHINDLQLELASDHSSEVENARRLIEKQAGQIISAESLIKEQQAQLERSERYADSLRQQLQDHTAATDKAGDTREYLELSVNRANSQLEELKAVLAEEKDSNANLSNELDALKGAHAEEIRIIRFELGEAQETVAQHELAAEELASNLVDAQGFRDELEQMLTTSEEQNRSRIEQLENENRRLLREAAENKDELESKSDAINCLLAELAKKSQQIDSIGEIEEVIHEIDDRMSERIEERSGKDLDRITRVLIGSLEDQELRFPLFKDRLTIGRTEQNDIQVKASYVSRRHAVIVKDRDATRVIDWGSKNGVFVNSKRITEHFLQNGDTVTIGTTDFRYEERPKRGA